MRLLFAAFPEFRLQKLICLLGIIGFHIILLAGLGAQQKRVTSRQMSPLYMDAHILWISEQSSQPVPEIKTELAVRTTAPSRPRRLNVPQPVAVAQDTAPAAPPDQPSTTAGVSSGLLDLDALRHDALAADRKTRLSAPQSAAREPPAQLQAESPLGQKIAGAQRANCRNAYVNGARIGPISLSGILVAGVILADTLTGKGCKW